MIKGHIYLAFIGVILLWRAVGEINYRISLREWKARPQRSRPDRFDSYSSAVLLTLLITIAIVLIVGMILTWNDPI